MGRRWVGGGGCSIKGERNFSQAELSHSGLGPPREDEECLGLSIREEIPALDGRLGSAIKCPPLTAPRCSGALAVRLCPGMSWFSAPSSSSSAPAREFASPVCLSCGQRKSQADLGAQPPGESSRLQDASAHRCRPSLWPEGAHAGSISFYVLVRIFPTKGQGL